MAETQEEKDKEEEARLLCFKAYDEERKEQDARLEKLIEKDKQNIPSNEEIIEMIPSKAVREYLVKIGHKFSLRDRYLLWLYLDPKKEKLSEELWENGRYVSVPHPFRRGDIVADFGYASVFASPPSHTGDYDLGIMLSFDDDKDWTDWDNDVKTRIRSLTDFSDVSTTVEYLYSDGSFSHNHPNPMQLEFARDVEGALKADSKKTTYLEVASDLIRGKGSIELLEMYKSKYTESAEHLNELLESARKNLHKYVWENFNSFRTLYFPNDIGEMQRLNSAQKDKAQTYIIKMERNVSTIENCIEDLVTPVAALRKKFSGYKGEEKYKEAKAELDEAKTIFFEIKEDYKLALSRVSNFTKMENAPRKQFYQKRLIKAVGKIEKLLSELHTGTKTEAK